MKPVVAIIGRPNVGKSTIFNRITRRKDALVDNFPGVTRDRKFGEAKWNDIEFLLIDTGGFLKGDEDDFAYEIKYQVLQTINDADVILLILDGKHGISPYDFDLVKILRTVSVPVYYIINKIDGYAFETKIHDFYELGIEKFYSVSGEHGYGINDFLDELVCILPKYKQNENGEYINVAVVGRPNVGKSSLINMILGEKRFLVSKIAGTTRDSIDSICSIKNKKYCMIDTAGIRKKSRVFQKIEKFSIIKSLESLDRCDVALILIDTYEGITDQDITIAGYAYERGCGCIFLLNKWDVVDKQNKNSNLYYKKLSMNAKFLNFAPALTISALTGLRVNKIFNLIDDVYMQYTKRIPTSQLNKIVETAIKKTEPSLHKGKRLKFYYSTQVKIKPPTFVCFVNYPEAIHFSYKRYVLNQIREISKIDKSPIKLIFRQRTGKIDFTKKKGENKHSKNKHDKKSINKRKAIVRIKKKRIA